MVFYRDDVRDGQIPYVVEHEVAAITNCFKEAGMEEVKFTFIIVSKRINTRLFRMNGKPTYRNCCRRRGHLAREVKTSNYLY